MAPQIYVTKSKCQKKKKEQGKTVFQLFAVAVYFAALLQILIINRATSIDCKVPLLANRYFTSISLFGFPAVYFVVSKLNKFWTTGSIVIQQNTNIELRFPLKNILYKVVVLMKQYRLYP